ncbi:hypothetical protein GQE99_00080 [Maritimibacter sp. DP07]|uniref:Uncharacterized protein n=1 Tax=Maritimibacter harenae TaxID=2606218 RepID=A0A845LXC0_9RHOB|nr:hypothetical protein [Maritimibacter harenae]MZR11429.1 hypothetical protein [Maritimibacter harenae]
MTRIVQLAALALLAATAGSPAQDRTAAPYAPIEVSPLGWHATPAPYIPLTEKQIAARKRAQMILEARAIAKDRVVLGYLLVQPLGGSHMADVPGVASYPPAIVGPQRDAAESTKVVSLN